MKEVIGLRFIPKGPITYYENSPRSYQVGDCLLVQVGAYIECATVVVGPREVATQDVCEANQLIQGVATVQELKQVQKNEEDALEAYRICREKVRAFNLEMKVIKAQYSFDRQKITFFFAAPSRVDFRSFVRELASIFHTRIELRQIGARDEAKILGGIGPCGRPLCCSSFMGDFVPVSIRMAKDQDLSLNTAKVSGICGRLMCCLNFENETYEESKRLMPDYGSEIVTPDGRGKVVGLQLLSRVVKVRLLKENRTVEYLYEELNELSV